MFMRTIRSFRPVLQANEFQRCPPVFTRGLRIRPGQSHDQGIATPSKNVPNQEKGTPNENVPRNTTDVSSVLSNLDPAENQLLAPVHIPEDKNAVLKSDHPATNILGQPGLVVTRQIEMMNIFLGFEQANRYVILDPQGNHLGYMAEHDGGIAKTMGRQWFKTHRAFTTHVFDKHAREVLRFHRPFSWINSRIRVYDALEPGSHTPISNVTMVSTDIRQPQTIDGTHAISSLPIEAMRIIGEAHSEWAPLRRKYNLFLAHELEIATNNHVANSIGVEPVPSDLSRIQQQQIQSANFSQFAYVDEPFLSWDFSLKGADGKLIGSVNRNFRGFGREIFTDTGMYVLRMDSVALKDEAQKSHMVSQTHRGDRAYAEAVGGQSDSTGMTLDQRALMLATAVTVDFDYFSRHSSGAGGWMPIPLWMGGGGEAAGGAAGAGAGAGAAGAEVGAAEAGGAVVGNAGRGVAGATGTASGLGAGEGAIAGAGSMAGYEAMQRSMGSGDNPPPPPPPLSEDLEEKGRGLGEGPDPRYFDQPGGPNDPQSPQSDMPPEDQDVWGSGDQDPWLSSQSPSDIGSGGSGSEEGGGFFSAVGDIISDIFSSFGGD